MRVLHIVNDFAPFTRAGTEHYLAALAREQTLSGLEPSVLHLVPAGHETAPPYSVAPGKWKHGQAVMLHVPEQDRSLLYNEDVLRAVENLLAPRQPDVVHIHSLIGFSVSLLDAVPDAVPMVMTFHDFWLPCANAIYIHSRGEVCAGPESPEKCAACQQLRLGEKSPDPDRMQRRRELHLRALQRLDLGLCPSLFSRRTYAAAGFDSPTLQRSSLGMWPLEEQKSASPRPGGTLRFTFLGSACWFKGLDLAVAAFSALNLDNARLDIHGGAANPDYLRQAMDLAAGNPSVVYHGGYAPEDVPRLLGESDALLLPSRMETFSFVAREALSAGVPVIAANSGALPEIIRHGRNGLLFANGDAAALARAMARIARDPGFLDALRQGIRPVKTIQDDAQWLRRQYTRLCKADASHYLHPF